MKIAYVTAFLLSTMTLSCASVLRTSQLERVLQGDENDRPACHVSPCDDMQGPCLRDEECNGELRCRRDQKCGWTIESNGLFQVRGEDRIYRADGTGNYFFVAKRDEYIHERHGFPVTWLEHMPHLQPKMFPYFQLAIPPLPGLINAMDSTPDNHQIPVFGLKTTVVTANLPVLTSFQPIYGVRGYCFTSPRKEFAGIVGEGAAPLVKCRRGSVVTKLTCLVERCAKIAVECSPMVNPNPGPSSTCEIDLGAPIAVRSYEALKSGPQNQIVCPDGYAITLLRWNFRGRRAVIICRKYQLVQQKSSESHPENDNGGKK